jgi:hypothetical protein
MLRRKYLAQRGTSSKGAMSTSSVAHGANHKLKRLKRQQVNNEAFKRVPDTNAGEHTREIKLRNLKTVADCAAAVGNGDNVAATVADCVGKCHLNAGITAKDLSIQSQHTYVTEVKPLLCLSLDESMKKPRIENIC